MTTITLLIADQDGSPLKSVALILFVAFFLGVLIRLATVKTSTYRAIARIPLEEEPVERVDVRSPQEDEVGHV